MPDPGHDPLFDSRPDLVADLRTLAASMDADRYPGADIVRDAADLLALDMADG